MSTHNICFHVDIGKVFPPTHPLISGDMISMDDTTNAMSVIWIRNE